MRPSEGSGVKSFRFSSSQGYSAVVTLEIRFSHGKVAERLKATVC